MRKVRRIALSVLIVAVVLGTTMAFVWAQSTPALPGITVKDEHPNGCVSCHQIAGKNDYRMPAELKRLKVHPDISAVVNTVPTDCLMCHKAGTTAGPLGNRLHKIHFQNPKENHFVSHYGGQCLQCHSLNLETGVMSVKSGPKNW